ncbi:hypothetical protein C7CDELTA_77 [Paenibacillus phage C7Cdelta]|uniref:Uncharacterized protein n=1 Tax=Paenibacillus phage C7Cdelta TaxID=2249773 RepID=A0A345ASN4_9CAUD|nr:hypothetical protein KMD17_gp77 [Paenibacillus phage C7Cdelta]AXF39838.1 hypothetical protein C7CDELTA_77 [Paenibacillus phage C7Cdelta]
MENVKYRKVKRAAKVGEKIRAVDAKPYWGRYYENGDKFEVIKTCANGVLCRRIGDEDEEGRLYTLWSSEYVVLEPIEEPDEISDIKNEMERLTGELATLALRVSKLEEPKSPQEIRDEIVERARAYIGMFDSRAARVYSTEYIVNRKKKTVVCLLRGAGTKVIRGIAKCAPEDVFNSHIGRAIALRRALRLEVPAEYLSVPNPTVVRIGDIVNKYAWVGTMHPYKTFQVGTKTDGESRILSLDSIDSYCTLTDDSREEGALDAYLA